MLTDNANGELIDSRVSQSAFWSAMPERWKSDVEETLVCCYIRQETHDVKSFFFRSSLGRSFAFEPGQFVTLELDIDGATINRCYTISSAPTRPHTLSITVKRIPGGAVSNWLHDQLRLGMAVRMLGPAGEFTCARYPADKYLFLSAGSGMTPLMSMSRAYHDLCEDRDIVFIHSARTPDDIIFARELDLIAANHRNFRTAFVCERVGRRTNWHGITGYLSLPLLTLAAPDFREREIFTCGPMPYMKAVRDLLEQAGFERGRYHEESFSFESLAQDRTDLLPIPAAQAATAAAETPRYTVSFVKSQRAIACDAGQHVLDAARQSGVRLPASCTQGMCGTCKVKLVSGRVEMKHNGGIRQREIDQGMMLLCCSKPLSDLVIDK